MLYCTKCGSDLKGNRVRCPVCGYEVQKMKMDLSKPLTEKVTKREERKPWAPPIPDQRDERTKREDRSQRRIERAIETPMEFTTEREEEIKVEEEEEEDVENDPLYVDGCSICGATPVRRCFFTLAPLCDRHTVWLQIFVRNMAFGEKVPAAPDIASRKEGRVPTEMEARDAGMFFSIKPYHQWKKVG
ncbi:MAG TPA: hypothetical protein ENK47_04090 [Euryarchaeota archaeon]|nr:hypothetical protein [Euryarchaeota archaeon]